MYSSASIPPTTTNPTPPEEKEEEEEEREKKEKKKEKKRPAKMYLEKWYQHQGQAPENVAFTSTFSGWTRVKQKTVALQLNAFLEGQYNTRYSG